MSKYSKEFKEEAIRLSDEIGNKKRQPSWDYRITRLRIGEIKASISQKSLS